MNFLPIFLLLFTGCVSAGYHQRKLREARGEPTVRVMKDEYKDFMEHKVNENAEIGEPYK